MIDKFNNIFYLIIYLVHFAGVGMYAYQTIISKTVEDGYQIVEEKNQNDGSIELVLTKWES